MDNLNTTTFASYRRALRSRNRSERTIESYAMACRELDVFLGGQDITTASKGDLERFFEKRLAEVRATTVSIRFRSLRAFFAWAVEEEILTRSPMKGMTEPKPNPQPVAVLPDDDLKALIRACHGKTFSARRDEAIVRILCEPGSPRLGELATMRVVDIDPKHDTITVTGKSGRRTFPFGAKTGTAIDRYLRLRAKHGHAGCPICGSARKAPCPRPACRRRQVSADGDHRLRITLV